MSTPLSQDEGEVAQEELRNRAARLIGQARTEAKARAARENGRKGGRPPGIPVSEETKRKISEAMRNRAGGPATGYPRTSGVA
jgi:hypothetical protein